VGEHEHEWVNVNKEEHFYKTIDIFEFYSIYKKINNIFTNNIISEFLSNWESQDGVWKWVIGFERKPIRRPLQWPQMLGIMSKQKECVNRCMYTVTTTYLQKKQHLSLNSQASSKNSWPTLKLWGSNYWIHWPFRWTKKKAIIGTYFSENELNVKYK
jgi:hypothetical protein